MSFYFVLFVFTFRVYRHAVSEKIVLFVLLWGALSANSASASSASASLNPHLCGAASLLLFVLLLLLLQRAAETGNPPPKTARARARV